MTQTAPAWTGPKPKTLSQILVKRIFLLAGMAMVIQVVVVLANYYGDNTRLAALMVEHESGRLMRALKPGPSGLRYDPALGPARYARTNGAYFTRIRTPGGAVIYSNCDASCGSHLLPPEINPPDLWSRLLRRSKPIALAGGRSFAIDGRKVFIELAVLDDNEHLMWSVLRRELIDHLAAPMSLMLVFTLGGMLLAVRLALQPVERAAREAESIDPLDPTHNIAITGMPREVADLASAVNRMLSRINSLMNAQRVYTTAIAHEIRTPLAMMRLELANIDHPRARKIEADLDALAHFVVQITDLGRLEGADRTAFCSLDLAMVARSVVQDIAPWIYDREHSIAFDDAGAGSAQGHAPLIENAIRNLIENAVTHTPSGTAVLVTAGPGSSLSVSDDAGLFGNGHARSLGEGRTTGGVGLEIVRHIMSIHRGRLIPEVIPGRRTTMRLVFDASRAEPARAEDVDTPPASPQSPAVAPSVPRTLIDV